MIAGTRTLRITNASIATADAKATPNSLIVRLPPSANEPNTQIMIVAAAVITRPVEARPWTTASEASLRFSHSSWTRDIRNTS